MNTTKDRNLGIATLVSTALFLATYEKALSKLVFSNALDSIWIVLINTPIFFPLVLLAIYQVRKKGGQLNSLAGLILMIIFCASAVFWILSEKTGGTDLDVLIGLEIIFSPVAFYGLMMCGFLSALLLLKRQS